MSGPAHSLRKALEARVGLLATTLRPTTVYQYRHTVGWFSAFLQSNFPELREPSQLRRDPHILAWFEHLWSRRARHSDKPLCTSSRAAHLIRLRKLLELLADHKHPPHPGLVLSQDIPRPDQLLPRPLPPEQDAALQAQLRRHNDLLANALLLLRLTGMRIGECVDLAPDCLQHLGDNRWAIHVPLGKLHSERWVPVDDEVRSVVARLAFLRTLPPAASPDWLLPRAKSRGVLCADLRTTLRQLADQAGITSHVVPHQLRHTYATAMLRAGVSLPALMKLLGHRTANMTLRYVEVTQKDLQREYLLARQTPRYLLPTPALLHAVEPETADVGLVLDQLDRAQRLLELYRQRANPADQKQLTLLARRLIRLRTIFKKLARRGQPEK